MYYKQLPGVRGPLWINKQLEFNCLHDIFTGILGGVDTITAVFQSILDPMQIQGNPKNWTTSPFDT